MSAIAATAHFGSGVNLLILLTGGIGSIYAREIRGAFPFTLGPFSGWSPSAALFWMLFIITGYTYHVRQRAVERHRAELQDRLIERTKTLEAVLRTQPPPDFLSLFAQLYTNAENATHSALTVQASDSPSETQEQAIRTVLRILAFLAAEFDGRREGVIYSANVMVFRAVQSIKAEERPRIERVLSRLSEPEASLNALRGVLELRRELSTRLDKENAEPDDHLEDLVLAVPEQARAPFVNPGERQGRYRVLPGAPVAFLLGEPSAFDDTSQLATWCSRHCDLSQTVVHNMSNYFRDGAGKYVASFVSIPLLAAGEISTDADPVAILNIHASKPGLLKSERDPIRQFVSVARPLQICIARLLAARGLVPTGVTSHPAGRDDALKAEAWQA